MPTQYVNKPGGICALDEGGSGIHLKYGDPVPDNLHSSIDASTFSDTRRRTAAPEDQQALESQRRAALTENGQVNSSSSPVPGNYSELDEDAAAQLVANLANYPESQAVLVKHEILFGGGRQRVVDAASDYARQAAEAFIDARPEVHDPEDPEGLDEPGVGFPDPTRADADERVQAAVEARAKGRGRSTPAPTSGEQSSSPDGGEATTFDGATNAQLDAYAEQHQVSDYDRSNKDTRLESLAKAGHEVPQTPLPPRD